MGTKNTRENFLAPKCGGWLLDPKPCINGALPEKIATAFGELFHGITGASYAPLVYCGSQVVNGTNYAIVCKVNYAVREFPTGVAMVILHETIVPKCAIMGDFSILSITDIAKSGGYGGFFMWPYPHRYVSESSDPIDMIFDNLEIYGSKFVPLAYCGIQSETGNMMFVCASTMATATSDPEKPDHIDVVVVSNQDEKFTLQSVTELL